MATLNRFALYDLDGTLVSSNVVSQYAWYVRKLPNRPQSYAKFIGLLLSIPLLFGLDLRSRTKFNIVFYRKYAGLRLDWLEENAEELFEGLFLPAVLPGAALLVEKDRAEGYQTVLVTGSLDFALGPLVRYFGFDHVISNRLVFRDGVATGELEQPLIAEAEKVAAIRQLARECDVSTADSKAYSDSLSDLPMLEAVGAPAVVNPERRLRRIAQSRGWPILNLRDATR